MKAEIFVHINPWVVLAAAIAYFVLGLIWYSSLLFGEICEQKNQSIKSKIIRHTLVFLLKVLICFGIAILFEWFEVDLVSQGLAISGTTCLVLVGAILGIYSIYHKKTLAQYLISLGHHLGGWLFAGAMLAF